MRTNKTPIILGTEESGKEVLYVDAVFLAPHIEEWHLLNPYNNPNDPEIVVPSDHVIEGEMVPQLKEDLATLQHLYSIDKLPEPQPHPEDEEIELIYSTENYDFYVSLHECAEDEYCDCVEAFARGLLGNGYTLDGNVLHKPDLEPEKEETKMTATYELPGFYSTKQARSIQKLLSGATYLNLMVSYGGVAGNNKIVVTTENTKDDESLRDTVVFFLTCRASGE